MVNVAECQIRSALDLEPTTKLQTSYEIDDSMPYGVCESQTKTLNKQITWTAVLRTAIIHYSRKTVDIDLNIEW